MTELTQERVKSVLDYDPETGLFYWKNTVRHSRKGMKAGVSNNKKAIIIGIDGRLMSAHRLAYLWMTGSIPEEIDHIDRNPSNNAWLNLRPANTAENKRNRGIPRNNTSGYKGVFWDQKKWRSAIKVDYQRKYLGSFDTAEEAARAYDAAARLYHGQFAYLNFQEANHD